MSRFTMQESEPDEQKIRLLVGQMRRSAEAEKELKAKKEAVRELDPEEYARLLAAEVILARERQTALAASKRPSPASRSFKAASVVGLVIAAAWTGMQLGNGQGSDRTVLVRPPVSGGVVVKPPIENTGPITSDSAVLTDRTEVVTAELKSAIDTADAAEIRAKATLDVNALASVYSGEALRLVQESVRSLAAAGVHAANELVSRTYDEIRIDSDGLGAKVKMTERWATQLYSNTTNEPVGQRDGPRDVPQTLYLRKGPNGWIITTIEFHR